MTGSGCEDRHHFTFKELEPGKGSNEQPYLKVLFFFNKKPGITEGFFHEHLKIVYADLTMSTKDIGVNLVLRFRQYNPSSSSTDATDIMLALLLAQGMKLVLYDYRAEFQAKDTKYYLKFVNSLYAEIAIPGRKSKMRNYIHRLGSHIMTEYDNLIFGSKARTSGGKDGISPDNTRLKYTKVEEKDS
ncbi:hypothetical protein K469DRAFT_800367 [Zopfia rhizophila CBS 207.26]|uniref:Uncharacterized protein n=1 Tax=Zopfia rhizophila CBS 207.26 TaxID=1314779 RepID=A0A6A6ELI6_9PEZI|nr:hypothetical protein K469DRAFT_800367 [Zopfia rhizophila CBS 207.26]